jgi:aminomethyltransferase
VTSQHTALHFVHVRAGATFTDFAGWDMPVRYSSDLTEHHAVRNTAGLFDLSHMAEIEIRGAHASAFLDYALSNRLSALQHNQAKYSLLLGEHGGVIDDLIVYRLGFEHYWIVANAANRTAAVQALSERTEGFDVAVSDISDDWALIAVQGPKARSVLEKFPGLSAKTPLDQLRYYRITQSDFGATPGLIARTGYTGEDGFELFVPVDNAAAVWDEIVEQGTTSGLQLCGLACRDTLRLEAGMPLYGHELGLEIHPYQAGLARVVDQQKERFLGKDGLPDGVDPTRRVLVGLVAEGRRAPRADYPVIDQKTGGVIGQVTSGALSPTLGYPIAMAYVDSEFSGVGTALAVDVRGQSLPVTVTKLPFYSREKETL